MLPAKPSSPKPIVSYPKPVPSSVKVAHNYRLLALQVRVMMSGRTHSQVSECLRFSGSAYPLFEIYAGMVIFILSWCTAIQYYVCVCTCVCTYKYTYLYTYVYVCTTCFQAESSAFDAQLQCAFGSCLRGVRRKSRAPGPTQVPA